VTAPDLAAITLRVVCYIAALHAAGVPLFRWLFDDELTASAAAIRRLAVAAAAASLLACVAYEAVEPARLAGRFAGIGDLSLQGVLLDSDAGTAFAVRLLGLVVLAVGVAGRGRAGGAAAIVGGTVVVASFAFVGHTVTHAPGWLLTVLLLVHLGVVAFWFGALLPFYLTAAREPASVNAAIIDRFSAAAIWLVPLILAAGVAMAAVLLPSVASLKTPYGALLLVKLSGFAVLMGLAALNKWRLAGAIRAGRPRALRAFRRSVLAEWVLIAAVVAATAIMTASFSPEP
jgi:putative copper export protein